MKTKNHVVCIILIFLTIVVLSFLFIKNNLDTKKELAKDNNLNSNVALANPASVNCQKQGGTNKTENQEGFGQYSLCYFDDNRACEEWAMYRGECPVGGVKTTGYDTIDQKFCAWLGGATYAEENSVCQLKNGLTCLTADLFTGKCADRKDITIYDRNDFYTILAKYNNDQLDTKKTVEQYIKYIVNQKQEDWKIGGKVYKSEQYTRKQFPDKPVTKYFFYSNYDKYESQKLSTVSYKYNNYEFTGGAHGDEKIATFTFNKNGKLEIDTVLDINNDNEIKLLKLIKDKILSDPKLKDYTDEDTVKKGLGLNFLDSKGVFNKTKCKCDGFFYGSNLQNFIISDEGITFIMDKYQVTSGAAGNPEVNFKWSELYPFVNKNFSLPLD